MKIKRKGYRQESREQENPTKQICYVKDSVLIFPPFTASKEGNKHQITTQRNPECKQRPCLSKLAKLSSHHSLQQSSLSCCKYILSIQNNNTNKLSSIANNGNSATDIQQYLSSFGGGGCPYLCFPGWKTPGPHLLYGFHFLSSEISLEISASWPPIRPKLGMSFGSSCGPCISLLLNIFFVLMDSDNQICMSSRCSITGPRAPSLFTSLWKFNPNLDEPF